MQAPRFHLIISYLVSSLLSIMLLAGCAQFDSLVGADSHVAPPVVEKSVTATKKSASSTKSNTKRKSAKSTKASPQISVPAVAAPPVEEIAILVSAEIEAMTLVAQGLKKQLGARAEIYSLNGNALIASDVATQLTARKNVQVVAIGLLAAQASKLIPHPQVFCQVFNFADYNLLADGRQGVSMLPPSDQVFSLWRQLTPALDSVIVATGPNQQVLVASLQSGAKAQGVKLHHVEVSSDKELIYTLKHAAKQAQGIWLLPDNRVLSRQVIRELIVFSVKNGKQLAVFTPQLLPGGALLSFSTQPDDIVQQVLSQLELLRSRPSRGSTLAGLNKLEVGINSVVAARLGLPIPANLKKNIR